MIVLHCSACGNRFEVSGTEAGEPRCPACGHPSITPPTTVPSPPPDAITLTHFPAPPPTRPPARLPTVPGYEILEELGRGGMGVVYKARQTFPRRVVALKMILGDFGGADRLARFRAEVAAAARVPHPNVVQVHEVGEHNGRPFFSMEYVEGGTLAQHLNGRPLPPEDAAGLVEQLARAVQHAHERGIIHRDLNPRNVLLSFSREPQASAVAVVALARGSRLNEAVPKITDFGLAKHLEGAVSVAAGPRTASGAILGTPAYMAPEQAAGKTKTIGPAVDVYALGAILYECLTGRPPFRGPTTLETLLKVAREEPPSPRQQRPGVPRDLDVICLKCLRKEPSSRYASAAELAEDLRRFRAGEAIKARTQSMLERAGRWVRRRRELAYLAGGALLAAAVGAAVLFLWPGRPTPPTAPTPAELPADLALVPDTALGFLTLRSGDLWAAPELHDLVKPQSPLAQGFRLTLEQFGRDVENRYGLNPRDLERVTFVLNDPARPGPGLSMAILMAARPFAPEQVGKTLTAGGRHLPEVVRGKTIYVPTEPGGGAVVLVNDRVLVVTEVGSARELVARPADAPPPQRLRAALQRAAGKHVLVAGLRPSPEFLAQVLLQRIPRAADAVARVRVAVLTLDVTPLGPEKVDRRFDVEGTLEYADDAQAEAARPHVPGAAQALLEQFERSSPPFLPRESFTALLAPVKAAAWERDGATVRAHAQADWKPEEVLTQAREAGEIKQSVDNLQRIGAALRQYHNRHGRYPPAAAVDEAGKPLFSWRVLLLPYLGSEPMYRRFHLNRAWDHPSNAALLANMPSVFASPRPGDPANTTRYQVIAGAGGMFDSADGRGMAEVPDGPGRTLLIAEAPNAIPWTKPDDLVATPEAFPQLGGLFRPGFNAVMADGGVRFIRADTPAQQLRALFTRGGREPDAVP